MSKKLKTIISKINANFLDPFSYALTFSYLFYMIMLFTRLGMDDTRNIFFNILLIFSGLLSINFLWIFIRKLLFFSSKIRFIFGFLILAYYNLLSSYHFQTHIPFDYTIMADNSGSAINLEALQVIIGTFSILILVIGSISILVLFIPYVRKKITNKISFKFTHIISFMLLYISLLVSPLVEYDEFTSFIKSLISYQSRGAIFNFDHKKLENYPLKHNDNFDHISVKSDSKPNIIVIMVESFNGLVINKKASNGKEYTPYFNSKIKDGVYIENYYGNSIQSCKGQFALLFSYMPSIKHKVFTTYTKNSFLSFPQILKNNGYLTMFSKGYKDINFDNTGNFVEANGIDEAFSIVPLLNKKEKKQIWGWGIEDKYFYKNFFEYLDTKQELVYEKKPFFALLHTVMNHMRFDKVPQNRKYMFPNSSTLLEDYANNIYLTDQQLSDFFQELDKRDYLENTIVIITGDHSFPLGEHGFVHNEASYYEEFFRTPFLLLWKNKLKQQIIKDSYSHMDVAPTLLDLTNINPGMNSLQGESIFSKTKTKPVMLVQPYNGAYIASVRHPFKYVYHLKTKKSFLYNLNLDPNEKKNILNSKPKILEKLKEDIEGMFLYQYLLDNDRVWHKKNSDSKTK